MAKYVLVVFVAIVLVCAFAPTPAKADSVMGTFVWVDCGQQGPNCVLESSGPSPITVADGTRKGIDHGRKSATDVPEPSALLQTGLGLGLGVIALWRKQTVGLTAS